MSWEAGRQRLIEEVSIHGYASVYERGSSLRQRDRYLARLEILPDTLSILSRQHISGSINERQHNIAHWRR